MVGTKCPVASAQLSLAGFGGGCIVISEILSELTVPDAERAMAAGSMLAAATSADVTMLAIMKGEIFIISIQT